MTTALEHDLKKFHARAYDRAEWAEGVLRRYHAAAKLGAAKVQPLKALYDWMFVPPTLWPAHLED